MRTLAWIALALGLQRLLSSEDRRACEVSELFRLWRNP